MTDLQQFVEKMHFGAIAISVAGSSPVVHCLNQLAAAQDDWQRCELANRMRESIEADGLKLEHGAYDFLLGMVAP
jgi:hypothetical protein